MSVNCCIVRVVLKKTSARSYIQGCVDPRKARDSIDLSAHLSNLRIVVTLSMLVDEEIKLNDRSVNGAIDIHDECLSAPAVHCANDV